MSKLKRFGLLLSVAAIGALLAVPMALAQTTTPAAPAIDVNAYATGIFDALDANLTQLLIVFGLLAGTFMVIGMVRRGRRG